MLNTLTVKDSISFNNDNNYKFIYLIFEDSSGFKSISLYPTSVKTISNCTNIIYCGSNADIDYFQYSISITENNSVITFNLINVAMRTETTTFKIYFYGI